MKFLVVSGRNHFNKIADALSFELEDTLVDCLEADMFLLGSTSSKEFEHSSYEALFIAVNNFSQLVEIQRLLEKTNIKSDLRCAYVFGGYIHTVEHFFNPLKRRFSKNYKALNKIDHIFTGILNNIQTLNDGLNIPVHYCPMAVDVLKIAAEVSPRPIAINGFGRQETKISNMIADTFNRAKSDKVYFHTNYLSNSGFIDRERYRKMFWQILRQSKLSLAFDSLHFNPTGHAKHSFVGPRWYESLGAGNVVVGIAPKCTSAAELLDWPDATIDLSEEPKQALEQVVQLLSDENKIVKICRRNLHEMNRKHDWRHRIDLIFDTLNLKKTERLSVQLEELQSRSQKFS
jgi:hypothetical protein